jgi:hypothetical protein
VYGLRRPFLAYSTRPATPYSRGRHSSLFAPGARSAGALLVRREGRERRERRAGANGCMILRKPRAVEASTVPGRGSVSSASICLTIGEIQPLASRVWIRRVDERGAADHGRPAPACVGRQKLAGALGEHPPHHWALTGHRRTFPAWKRSALAGPEETPPTVAGGGQSASTAAVTCGAQARETPGTERRVSIVSRAGRQDRVTRPTRTRRPARR